MHLFTHITLHLTIWVDWGNQETFLDAEATGVSEDAIILLSNQTTLRACSDMVLPEHPDQFVCTLPQPVGVTHATDLPAQDRISHKGHQKVKWIPLHRIQEYPLSRLMQNVLNQARTSLTGAVKVSQTEGK